MIESKEYSGGINGIPQYQDRKDMWENLTISHFELNSPAINEYKSELEKLYVNGSVKCEMFLLGESEVLDWYVSRNQLKEMLFFWKLWEHPVVNEALKINDIDEDSNKLFKESSPFILGGGLAWVLDCGGAYNEPAWEGSKSKELGEKAALELLNDDFDNCVVFEAGGAWCGYFYDVAWDYTWVVLNKSTRMLKVIMATDTD